MPLLPDKVNEGITPETERVVISEFKLGLPFKVTDLENKFQMICLRGT